MHYNLNSTNLKLISTVEMSDEKSPTKVVEILSKVGLNEEIVEQRIKSGNYTSRKHAQIGRVGRFYRFIQDIFDEQGKQLEGFYHCRFCNGVVKCQKGRGTAPLNRHADEHDAKNGLYSQYSH